MRLADYACLNSLLLARAHFLKCPPKKAVVVHETGPANSPQALSYEEMETPNIQPNHALVRNVYAGLNFIDTYHRSGLYARSVPFILGQEGAGTIVALGDSQETVDAEFGIGQRVVYSTFGSYAEYTLVPLSQLVSIPPSMDYTTAIAAYVQGLTAHYLTTSAHANLISKGDSMLIYSVGSGTGQWAAQMAKLQGFHVIGTCSSGKQRQAEQCHCDALIVLPEVEGKGLGYADYEGSVDVVQKVMEVTNNKGVKCVLDGVGKSTYKISLKALAPRGIFVSFGNASGTVPPFPLTTLTSKSAFCTRPKLKDYIASREELQSRMKEVFGWIQEGKVKVCTDCEFDLENVQEAHEYMEAGNSRGKILFQVSKDLS